MSIRCMFDEDRPWAIDQLRVFHSQVDIIPWPGDEYARCLLTELMQHHYIRVSYNRARELTGILGAMVVPHYLNPRHMVLSEVFWWVSEEHRGTRAGFELLRDYIKFARANEYMATLSLENFSKIGDNTLRRLGFEPYERSFILRVK